MAGTLHLDGDVTFSGYIKGETDRSLAIYPNTDAWNSRAWLSMWGPEGERAGELALAGSYVDLRYGSTTESYGAIGLRLDATGKVGIGTLTPSNTLDVVGDAKITGALQVVGSEHAVYGIGTQRLSQDILSLDRSGGTTGAYPYIEWRRNGTRGAFLGWGIHGSYLQFNLESGNNLALTGGNMGIGTTTPQYALDVNGTIRAGTWVSPSDVRWKDEIRPLDQALERLQRMRGVTFRWKDPARGADPQIGLIAQEVEAIFPEVVSTDSEGYKSIAYDKLVAPLIEAVKTLKVENDWLNARNRALRAKQAELERRLDALEAALETQQK